jgi:Kef-type K+ transport system membrane component KefB
MNAFAITDISLPFKSPVIIFSLMLFIVLYVPIVFKRIKVPHITGLIIAGVVIGPHGLNLLTRDSSIVLFGTVGLLYIMFLAGLELDLVALKKNGWKILVFGLATFLFPFILGSLISYYILKLGLLASLLLASMFSTHTLVSYPLIGKYDIRDNPAVTLAVGGTMITDVLALLVLAAVAGTAKGTVTPAFWLQFSVATVIFVCIVFFVFPPVTKWFLKKNQDPVSQYLFILAMVFLAAFLAEMAGLEAIVGAFFAGLILNQFVPNGSPLMKQISFVGNAIFIPFFLIGVGMLVDIAVLTKGWMALEIAGIILLTALVTKYLAAKMTQQLFGLSANEGNLLFGLSASHAAATLAIILVGYNIIIGKTATGIPVRLFNEDVLNATIILILVSCATSSFVVERAAKKIQLK